MTIRHTAALALAVSLAACSTTEPDGSTATNETAAMDKDAITVVEAARVRADVEGNPLLAAFDTPFGVPPFDEIDDSHFLPALEYAIEAHAAEVEAIAANPAPPTFENTIEALELSGDTLTRVASVFFPLNSANTNDTLRAVAREIGPQFSRHRDRINLDPDLFARVKAVYESADREAMNADQRRLLEETYKGFARGGANLDAEAKEALREVNERLSVLSIQFGENVLNDTNDFRLVIEDEADLAGLPEQLVSAAADAAAEADLEGKWVFTLHRPSIEPFLQFSPKRELRELIYKGYINKGNNANANDNKKILAEMAALRARRAALLGYPTHAHFVLEDNMAKTPENVYALIDQLWPAALDRARAEVAEMQAIIDAEGGDFDLEAWDWRYYSEKVRKARYDFDEDELRPYFQLADVIAGAFMVANKLYGITFEERTDLPVYHEDVKTYEVREADGELIGIYYTDWFPRAGKRGGAWMNSFRKQHVKDGENVLPIITNVGNFTKPTAGKPSLLRFSEANTLFHEFGHAIHGLLSDGHYHSLTGTSVSRDFVEFPSQVMENWAAAPEVLKTYAKHYDTGEPIPDDLIAKIENASKFNQGFATTEYLAASLLDLDWHTLTEPVEYDTAEFEKASLEKMGLIPQIDPRYRSTYFQHIFAGGYSSGYYSYIWSEVLDADMFQAFKESGDLFDQELATRFRSEILARGGAEEGMVMYRNFRGKDPSVTPLIERRGLGSGAL